MLISVRVLQVLAARLFTSSLNKGSGQAGEEGSGRERHPLSNTYSYKQTTVDVFLLPAAVCVCVHVCVHVCVLDPYCSGNYTVVAGND